MPPGHSFNNICRDRIRGASQLTAHLIALVCRKLFQRKHMQLDEQVIGALPRDESVMAQWHIGPRMHQVMCHLTCVPDPPDHQTHLTHPPPVRAAAERQLAAGIDGFALIVFTI